MALHRQRIIAFDFNQHYENVQFVHVLTTDYYRRGNPYKLFPKRGLSQVKMTFSLPLDTCQPVSIIMTVTEGCWSGMVNVYFNGRLKVDGLEKYGDDFQTREITLELDDDDILQRDGNIITMKLREDASMVYWLSDARIDITARVPESIGDVLNQDVLKTEKVVEIIYPRAASRCTSTIAEELCNKYTTAKEETGQICFQLKSDNGELVGSCNLSLDTSAEELQKLCRYLLPEEKEDVYLFFINDTEITGTIGDVLNIDQEVLNVMEIIYQPQAIFRVRAVSRCTSTIAGHAAPVLSASFSRCGRYLASGSGDTTVRLGDLTTERPPFICKGHKHWVLCIAWSCDGRKLASGCKSGEIILWKPETGKQLGRTLKGHRQWITSLSWEPLHRNSTCRNLASSSKDSTIKIWNTDALRLSMTLSGHTQSVTCVKWGGEGLIYSASQDRTIKVWKAENGMLCRTLQGHGHWVNTMALNTDYAIRTGAFDPVQICKSDLAIDPLPEDEQKQKALERYQEAKGATEKLVSGSDDFTLFLWEPEDKKKSIARMTGHQGLINCVMFSPDGRLIASASFDKSIKLWDGNTGNYLRSLRGHVESVYQIACSPDSRLLVSGSADSTLKVWDVKSGQLEKDLPGHADEVYTVDWSPDGMRVVSGGKDKALKIWRS